MSLITPSLGQAARLYAQNKLFGQGLTNGPSPSTNVAEPTFGDFMKSMAKTSIEQLQESEAVSVAGTKGKASSQQVVEAVMAAELTLNSAIAIRDKMVQAYQEILRMPV
ncbi:flagellar hook-basal body complex protein FliE [Rhodospirillaceae bacterium SYSU D60014]|uniref:flagellar hook-basal body complex protein FliE n=1 Tax=Virgifigura deserti TaxID=2268457 RepID=UPI000E6749A9